MREEWWGPLALLEREADLEETEREDCLDLRDPRENLVFRDFLAL